MSYQKVLLSNIPNLESYTEFLDTKPLRDQLQRAADGKRLTVPLRTAAFNAMEEIAELEAELKSLRRKLTRRRKGTTPAVRMGDSLTFLAELAKLPDLRP